MSPSQQDPRVSGGVFQLIAGSRHFEQQAQDRSKTLKIENATAVINDHNMFAQNP